MVHIYIIFSSTYFKSFFTRKTLVEKKKEEKVEKSEERIIDAANPFQLAIHYLRRNTYALNFPRLSFSSLSSFFFLARPTGYLFDFSWSCFKQMNRDGEFFKFPPTTSYATSKVAHTYTRTCTRWLYANESIEIALDCVTGESGRVYIYIYHSVRRIHFPVRAGRVRWHFPWQGFSLIALIN